MNLSQPFTSAEVAQYYDSNTRRFLRFGGSRGVAAIHRRVWAPEVQDAEQAFVYLNRLVLEAIRPALASQPPGSLVLDLGCGVGGTATWLCQQADVPVLGLSNSPLQVSIAAQRAAELGLGERCRFLLADFQALPLCRRLSATYAIESFVHAGDSARFFQQAAAALQPGGRLVVCDDFLSGSPSTGAQLSTAEASLRRFRNGWHLNSLITVEDADTLARQAGLRLIQDADLTPYLRLYHPLLLGGLSWLTRLPIPSTYWKMHAGGIALQTCLKNGWVRFHALVWQKSTTA